MFAKRLGEITAGIGGSLIIVELDINNGLPKTFNEVLERMK